MSPALIAFLEAWLRAAWIAAILIMGILGFIALGYFVASAVADAVGMSVGQLAVCSLAAVIAGAAWTIAEGPDA